MKPLPCLLQSYPLPSKMVLFMSPWLLACSQRLWLPHSTLFSADAIFPTGGLHHLHGIEDLLCRLALHRHRVAYGRGCWEALWWLLWRTWTYGTPYTITAEGFSSCKAAEGAKDLAFNFHSLIFSGPFFWASPLCHGKNLFTSSFLCLSIAVIPMSFFSAENKWLSLIEAPDTSEKDSRFGPFLLYLSPLAFIFRNKFLQ